MDVVIECQTNKNLFKMRKVVVLAYHKQIKINVIHLIRTNVDKDDDDDNDDDDDGSEEQLNMTPKGDIVQYTSLWQVRLGFFFLDKIRESDASSTDTSTRSFNAYYEDLTPLVNENASYNVNNHEFQMIDPTENNNSSITDDSCIISTRTYVETEERPVIKTISMKNCSKPRYALCETKRLIVDNFQQGCFRKPLIMDLPALISTRLTHELCLTVCKELQTTLVLIHINKCYCLNNYVLRKLNLTIDLGKYQQNKCGQPCKGNSHEQCGDDDTIVVFDIMESQQSNLFRRKPLETYPDFIYDSCIQTNSFHPNTSYKFVFNDTINLHSRHCLELCTKYEQKYALINSNQCFCTNIPIKNDANNIRILANQMCSQICSANYFYTCGSQIDPAIYSMYIKRPKCRHNFEVAQNDEQCVYSHYSNLQDSYALAQSYCNSLGSEIAKVSNTLELQEILSKSIISSHLYLWKILMNYRSSSSSIDFPRYFWIDRSVDTLNNYNVSYNLFTKCSQSPDKPDRNCLALIMKRTLNETELCITESNQCSSASAIPVCVDPKFQSKSNVLISPYRNDQLSEISTNILSDYSCGDNQTDYHFIDEYCYKISFHEVSWNQAKSECERDNAMLFVPEKALTLKYIRSLFLHRTNYASSGYAHVGVIYDNQNRTVIQYNNDNNKTVEFIPDSNTVYDICEVTFHERYSALVSSMNERNRIKEQQIGCAYIDLLADIEPVIRCDEIPCNRTATVICQKLPLVKTKVVIVKREQIIPSLDSHSKSVPSMSSSSEYTKSIGRDFAPIFFILIILFTFILLGFISILYNHRILSMGLNQRRQNINPVYSQLTLISEFNTD
ncbi:hypothetical protein I4U23_002318 [Adineta vaga]|nr:hypothetical protein I4U23_002318 [Adineta vaga]